MMTAMVAAMIAAMITVRAQHAAPILALLAVITNANAATLHVDPSTSSKNAGNRFATIASALAKLQPGDTVLIADGIYRESIDLEKPSLRDSASSTKMTRIEAAPNAHPVIKGSDLVTGWRRLTNNLYVKNQWQSNSQQVFVNGKALKQIGGVIFGDFPLNPKHQFAALHKSQGGIWPGRTGNGTADLVDESFYYDREAETLYVKTSVDLTENAVVEVSTRPYLIIGTGVHHITIRGIGFAHANTTAVSQSGAITLIGNHLIVDNVTVEHVDGAGFDLTGNDNSITRSTANYCGIVGMKVRGRNAKVIDNETSFNNTRGFNKWWEAGGAKFVGAGGLQDSEVSGHRAYANNGDGIWFDWHNDNNRIHGSIAAYNAGMGIQYEASRKAWVYDNYLVGNTQRGIYLPNSSESVIAHNLIAANGMEGIAIVDERHAAKEGIQYLVPRDNRVIGNLIAWNGRASIVLPLDADNLSDGNAFFDVNSPSLSQGWPTREKPLAQGLPAWRAQSGQDSNSWSQKSPLPTALKVQVDARLPLTATTLREWQELMDSVTARTPTMADVDAQFSRPGSTPGPHKSTTANRSGGPTS
jgi:parallel beta-helix repeat protein